MDRRTLTRDEAIDTVRRYKQVISPRYKTEPKVILYGSYAKGYANRPMGTVGRHRWRRPQSQRTHRTRPYGGP